MRIGTLFSGIGAPEQAAQRVFGEDFKMVFACEWDQFARKSFKAIYEIDDAHFHKDINDMDGKQYAGKVDCIIGGSPCQDFSIAGLRAGVDGNKGVLIWQYFRIIDEVRPPVFIYENVKGMISDNNGKTIQDFLEVFRSIGYFCHWDVLNSKDYGVPQNRERVFIVGFLDHEAYYRFQFAPKIPLEKRLKDVLESEVDEKYYLPDRLIDGFLRKNERYEKEGRAKGHTFEPSDIEKPASCLNARYYKSGAADIYINEGVVGMLDIKGNDQIRRVYGTDGSAPCLQTMQGGNREPKILQRGRGFNDGGLHEVSPTLTKCAWENNNHPIEPMVYDDYNGRLKDDGVACALTSNCGSSAERSGQKVIEPTYRIRKLTPLECWRLQDFPDEAHEKAKASGVSDSQRYKQAGNSITVAVMEMILRQVDRAIKCEKSNSLLDWMVA